MSGSAIRNTLVVGSMTLVSRVLGMVRDMVFARLGVGVGMDAFFVAFKIPNFMRRLFAEGAFSQAFVPVLTEYKATRSPGDVQFLVDRVAGTLAGSLGLLTLAGMLATPLLVVLFAPGFLDDPVKFDLTAFMLRLTFPYLLFMALVAFAAGILNSYGRFGMAALAPVWLNVVLIVAALWVAPKLDRPVLALAAGVLVAGPVQLVFLLPALRHLTLLPRPRWGWKDPGVRKVLRLMGPGILGSSVAQINLLFDTLIASFLVTGSVSWLYYADRLVEFPLGIFGVALGTVILPMLATRHAKGEQTAFSATLDKGLRWVLLIGLPATVGLVVLARPAVATLFQYGDFERVDVEMSGLALVAFGIGLPGFMLVKILAPAFYARQDTRTPVRVAVTAMIANMVLNLLFAVPMVLLGVTGAHAGLALATALASYLNAGQLYWRLRASAIYLPQPGWRVFYVRLGTGCAVLAGALLAGTPDLPAWLAMPGPARALVLGGWITGGVALYLVTLRLTGVKLSVLWAPGRSG